VGQPVSGGTWGRAICFQAGDKQDTGTLPHLNQGLDSPALVVETLPATCLGPAGPSPGVLGEGVSLSPLPWG
jgi:hypothetical protein